MNRHKNIRFPGERAVRATLDAWSSVRHRWLALLAAVSLGLLISSCDSQFLGARQVSLTVRGPIAGASMRVMDVGAAPLVTAYLLDCAAGPCNQADAILLEPVNGTSDAMRMTSERCIDDRTACELVFTPSQPELTVWLVDGSYALQARAYTVQGDVPRDYCLEGDLATFEVGPGKANEVTAVMGECVDVVYFDSAYGGTSDGSKERPFSSLHTAIDEAPEGGTVYVLPGVHLVSQPVVIDKPMTLSGASTAGPGVAADGSMITLAGVGLEVAADDVTIRNLQFKQSLQVGVDTIRVSPAIGGGSLTGFRLESTEVQTSRNGVVLENVIGATLDNILLYTSLAGDNGVGLKLVAVQDVTVRSTAVGLPGEPASLFRLGSIGLYTSEGRGVEDVSIDAATIDALVGGERPKGRTVFAYDEFERGIEDLRFDGVTYAVYDSADPIACDESRATGAGYVDYARSEMEATALAATCEETTSASAVVKGLFTEPDGAIAEGSDLFVGPHMSIQAAIDAAASGDTVWVRPGAEITSTVNVTKQVTVTGFNGEDADDTALDIESGINPVIRLMASATLEHVRLELQENIDLEGGLVYVGADNATVRSSELSGQFNPDPPEAPGLPISRAMLVATGVKNLTVAGNTIHNLRQPAYLNPGVAGSIVGNTVYNTFGWVVDRAEVAFEGNYWNAAGQHGLPSGNIKCDIALLVGTTFGPPYDSIEDLEAANGGNLLNIHASGCDQRQPAGDDG